MQIGTPIQKTETTTRSIGSRSTKPKNFKPRNGRIRLHAPPQTHDDPRLNPSNLCKSVHNFGNLTEPWSFTALDQQSPKISGPKAQERAATRRPKIRRNGLQSHAPGGSLTRLHARTRHTCKRQRSDVIHDVTSTADPFAQIRPGPTRTEPEI